MNPKCLVVAAVFVALPSVTALAGDRSAVASARFVRAREQARSTLRNFRALRVKAVEQWSLVGNRTPDQEPSLQQAIDKTVSAYKAGAAVHRARAKVVALAAKVARSKGRTSAADRLDALRARHEGQADAWERRASAASFSRVDFGLPRKAITSITRSAATLTFPAEIEAQLAENPAIHEMGRTVDEAVGKLATRLGMVTTKPGDGTHWKPIAHVPGVEGKWEAGGTVEEAASKLYRTLNHDAQRVLRDLNSL